MEKGAEKKRVYQVAKNYHISSEALVNMLREMGFTVKSHMSVVDPSMLEQIDRKFQQEKESSREEVKRKSIIRDKMSDEVKVSKEVPKKKGRKKTQTKKKTEVLEKERKKKRKKRHRVIDQKQVEESVKKVLAQIEGPRFKRRKSSKEGQIEEHEEEANVIRVSEFITVSELAEHMGLKSSEVISKCLQMGLMVTINQRLDMDTIIMVADEFGYEVESLSEYGESFFEGKEDEEDLLAPRPPVVTIMGHVDHGKTSLLDRMRKSNLIAEESGGITQHIGAYEVAVDGGKITFLDTPGHEAFTAMRARGAQVTDIVVLVIAADESVMPQTIEAIDHARAAQVPIIVTINKIDLPNSNPQRIKQQLGDRGILVEDWGGDILCAEVSAKTGDNIDKLLELILLQAELLELKARPKGSAKGTIIESRLDKGRGPVATVLVQNGILKIGDPFVSGLHSGRVRAMLDEWGNYKETASPSTPVQVLGFSGVPQAGDPFYVVPSEHEAKEISQKRQQIRREMEYRKGRKVTLTNVYERIKEGEVKTLFLIVKADTDGSVGALSDSLMQIGNDEVRVEVIHQGVGAISESDVLLASASDAVILGFHVSSTPSARDLAEREDVDIRTYTVIYEAIQDVKKAIAGILPPEISESIVGTLEVRETFKVPQIGTVAGCYVQSGRIRRGANVRVIRNGVVVNSSVIASLKRFKDDAREVSAGYECGVGVRNFNDLKVGDVIEVIEIIETRSEIQ